MSTILKSLAVILIVIFNTIYLPIVYHPEHIDANIYATELENELVNLIITDGEQQRNNLTHNPLLGTIAREYAEELAHRTDGAIIPHVDIYGRNANKRVRDGGYVLPSSYKDGKNNLESLHAYSIYPEKVLEHIKASRPHREHVLGERAFYRGQTQIGVGYYFKNDSTYKRYWVILIAH